MIRQISVNMREIMRVGSPSQATDNTEAGSQLKTTASLDA